MSSARKAAAARTAAKTTTKCPVCAGPHEWKECPKAREEFSGTLSGKKRSRDRDSDAGSDSGSDGDESDSTAISSSSDGGGSGSDHESSAASRASSVSKCDVCSADDNDSCTEDCVLGKSSRNKRIKARKKRRIAEEAAAGAAAAEKRKAAAAAKKAAKDKKSVPKAERDKALKAGKRPGTQERLDEATLKALQQSDLAMVPFKSVAPYRELWRPWIWGKPVPDRKPAYDKWLAAVTKMYHLDGNSHGKCTADDQKRAKIWLDGIAMALDPEPDLGTAALVNRLESMVDIFALQLMAWSTAREEGWYVARAALAHHNGEAQQPKAWQASIAVARKKIAETASGKGASQSPSARRFRKRTGAGKATGKGGAGGKGPKG